MFNQTKITTAIRSYEKKDGSTVYQYEIMAPTQVNIDLSSLPKEKQAQAQALLKQAVLSGDKVELDGMIYPNSWGKIEFRLLDIKKWPPNYTLAPSSTTTYA